MSELRNLYILFAEDDFDDGEILYHSFLDHQAFDKVKWVKNGKELLDELNSNPDNKPDLILTDINMPLVNGFEALEIIFDNNLFANIPTFVYSSANNPAYQKKCKELGVKAFIEKPFSLTDLAEIPYQIIYWLNQSERLTSDKQK